MQIVIDIPKDLYEGIERRDGELETEYVCDELMKAVDNGAPLPNGITNGGMIKAMFPKEEVIDADSACVYYGTKMRFDKDLWNAPYKVGGEAE